MPFLSLNRQCQSTEENSKSTELQLRKKTLLLLIGVATLPCEIHATFLTHSFRANVQYILGHYRHCTRRPSASSATLAAYR